eukprot:gene12738-15984_t
MADTNVDISSVFLLSKNNSTPLNEIIHYVPLDINEVQTLVPAGTDIDKTYMVLFSDGSLLIINSVSLMTSIYVASTKTMYLMTQINGYEPGSPFVMSCSSFAADLVFARNPDSLRGYMAHPIDAGVEMQVLMII